MNFPKPCELRNTVSGWSREEYFADSALNFHTLWDFQRDPKLFAAGFFDLKERNDAMRQGTQIHQIVLEGEEVFRKENALWDPPVNEKTGKPYGTGTAAYIEALDAWNAENGGKDGYSLEEFALYEEMKGALMDHPLAGPYLFAEDNGENQASELMFKGEYLPGWFSKGSIDRYDAELGILDLKTCAELERFDGYESFKKTCLYSGYLEQLAFYQIMFRELMDPRQSPMYIPVTIIGIEKKPPFRVAVCQPDDETQAAARERVLGLIEEYIKAVSNQEFSSKYDNIVILHRNY